MGDTYYSVHLSVTDLVSCVSQKRSKGLVMKFHMNLYQHLLLFIRIFVLAEAQY